jgi:hypothetical protein
MKADPPKAGGKPVSHSSREFSIRPLLTLLVLTSTTRVAI